MCMDTNSIIDSFEFECIVVELSNKRNGSMRNSENGFKYDLSVKTKNNENIYSGSFFVSVNEVTAKEAFETLLFDMRIVEPYIKDINPSNAEITNESVLDLLDEFSDDNNMTAGNAVKFVTEVFDMISAFEKYYIDREYLYDEFL